MNSEEILKLAEQQSLEAARIINRVILKPPEGTESTAAKQLVGHTVSAAMLQMSAVQKAAMEQRGRNE